MNSRWLAYVPALLALGAGGYACKGPGESSSAFIRVLDVAPGDGQTDVPLEARIGFRVDVSIDPASLNTQTFFLTDESGTLIPSAVLQGDEPGIAELKPNEPLAVITSYTATVTTGLLSISGATLEENFEWAFRTLDSEWGVSEWLETIGTGTSSQPEITVDAQLNALAVWQYTDTLGDGIYASRYTRSDLWGDPEPIDDGGGGATEPRLASDDAGNGFAVWEQSDDGGLTSNIWTNRYDVEQGWGTPGPLQNGDVTPARLPSVAADPAGNAMAVWVQVDTDTMEQIVWANRYQPGTGWGAAAPIDDDNPGLLVAGRGTAVGMDDDGNAIATWLRPSTPGNQVIWANRYTAGEGWGNAKLIKADPATEAREPRLAVAANGDAFVIWAQNSDTRRDIWTARFSNGAWEESPARIDSYDGGSKQEPDIAVDGAGVGHAVWGQQDEDDGDLINLWASQYTPGSGWGTPELIEEERADPRDDGPVRNPRVGVNDAGNAFAVWAQVDNNWLSIWSNRLDPGTGWMTAEPIEDIVQTGKLPLIAVDDNRHAHAVWLHTADPGVNWVRTNRFE